MNIRYTSDEIVKYFSSHRDKWQDLYPSERWIFKKIGSYNKKQLGDVLDVGCACGGLGTALQEKFILSSYTGIDINRAVISWAKDSRRLSIPAKFIAGDIISLKISKLYDIVVSLSCADWNIETKKIIAACWRRVKPGGYFVISLRLTPEKGINDIKRSYQYINYSGSEKKPEIANYVVFNFKEALKMMENFSPRAELIEAYGYWGRPSPTAATPFKKLVFAVFAVKKGNAEKIKYKFHLPPTYASQS